jgi:hypothetical protein
VVQRREVSARHRQWLAGTAVHLQQTGLNMHALSAAANHHLCHSMNFIAVGFMKLRQCIARGLWQSLVLP